MGDNLSEVNAMKSLLDAQFKIKDLGNLKLFLSMEIARSKSLAFTCTKEIHFGPPPRLWRASCQTDISEYQRLIGNLTHIRHDISYACEHIFCSNPLIIYKREREREREREEN